MKRLFIVFTLFFIINANADTLKNLDEVDRLVQNILKYLEKDELNQSLDFIKSYMIISDAEFETLKKRLNDRSSWHNKRFGSVIGSQLLEKEVGTNRVQIKFSQRYAKHVVEWKLILTKGKDGWVLDTFDTINHLERENDLLQWNAYSNLL